MAEDAPVSAPPETNEKTEQSPAEKPANKAPENSSSTDDKPADSANVTDEKKESEAGADKAGASGEATEAKGDGEDATAAADGEAAPEANGAPASTKKTSKDRRRSSGVGEKKLSRKKSMTRVTQLNAKPGEYYLARLRSYAPWPAIICDEEILPVSLIESRPVTAAQEDGTYRADYADDGKRAHERTFPVMFFETNEFAWIINTNLTPLDPADCRNVVEKNKSKQLLGAYKVAAEGHDLEHFKKLLSEHQNAIDEEMVEQEKKDAEKAEKVKAKAEKAQKAEKAADKAKKTKRKSKGAETDVEMEDADDTKKSKSSAKKRKNEAGAETEKPSKTPKTATKIKLTTPKASAEESGKKTPASKAKKAASKKGKAAAASASDEEETAASKEPEKQANPEELKKKKEKEVLFLRHKLQKGFISRDQPPKEDEMAAMASYFDKLEKHADLEVSIIRSTKINKVLKMIVKLNSIPRDEDFSFRQRAIKILSNWKNVLDSDAPTDGAKPTANGASKDEDAADTPKLEIEEEKEPETKNTNDDTPMPDAEADTKEETEKAVPKENESAVPEPAQSEEKSTEEKTEASA